MLIDVEENFNFRLYAYTPGGIGLSLFFTQSSKEISLVHREDMLIGAYFLLAVFTPMLLPSKFESGESMMTYRPQRILCEFGFD